MSSELSAVVTSRLRRARRMARAAIDLSGLCLRGHARRLRFRPGQTVGPDGVVVVAPVDDYSPHFKQTRDVIVTDHDYVTLKGGTLFFNDPTYAIDRPRYLPQTWVARVDVDTCFGLLLMRRSNYYHDVKDVFFSMYRFNREHGASIPILVFGDLSRRDRDMLAVLGIRNPLLRVPKFVAVHVKRYLTLSPRAEFALRPPRTDDERAADRTFRDYLDVFTSAFAPAGRVRARRKIFVTRRPPYGRVPANVDEIEASFAARGYEVVDFARHPLAEQVAIAAGSAAVAGLHGAGFANMFFAPPGTPLLEIFTHDWTGDCYQWLCESFGHPYEKVVVDTQAGPGQGFTLPLPALEASLRRFDERVKERAR